MEKLYRVYKDDKGIFFIAEDIGKEFMKKIRGELLAKGYTKDEAVALKKLLGEGNDTKQ